MMSGDQEGEALHQCMTKGVKGAAEEFERGMSWVTSRRGTLKLFQDRFECGNWTVSYEDLTDAVLFKTKQCFITCYILKLRTSDTTYQFGLNPNKYWEGELPFEVTRESGRLKYSMLSLLSRLALLAVVIWYFIFRK